VIAEHQTGFERKCGEPVLQIPVCLDFAAFDDGYGDWNIPWAQYAN